VALNVNAGFEKPSLWLAKHGELGLHLLFWALYFVYPLAEFAGPPDHEFNYRLSALQTATSVLPVYGFYQLALPRLFAAKQYVGLGLGGLGLAASFAT
jgi:hypothetical protein